jgi:hypothetical protein
MAASFTTKLDAYEDLTADEHRAISYGTLWTLFPRFAPKARHIDHRARQRSIGR